MRRTGRAEHRVKQQKPGGQSGKGHIGRRAATIKDPARKETPSSGAETSEHWHAVTRRKVRISAPRKASLHIAHNVHGAAGVSSRATWPNADDTQAWHTCTACS